MQLNKLCPFADKALRCLRVESDDRPGVVMVLDATPLPVSSPGFMFSQTLLRTAWHKGSSSL